MSYQRKLGDEFFPELLVREALSISHYTESNDWAVGICVEDLRKTTQNLSQGIRCPSLLRFEADTCQLHVEGVTTERSGAMADEGKMCFLVAWPAGQVP
jgi:hypothetical protein